MSDDNVNRLFTQFKNKYVSVDLRGDYQTEGKIIAIDNYLNIVLESENGMETLCDKLTCSICHNLRNIYNNADIQRRAFKSGDTHIVYNEYDICAVFRML